MFLFFTWIGSLSPVFSQYSLTGFSLADSSYIWYDQQIGMANTVLQNGEKYAFIRKSPNTHAYYMSDHWMDMNIDYSGQHFDNVQALYDIEDDVLVINNTLSSGEPIKLTKALVTSFEIKEQRFVYIPESVGFLSAGYFKELYLNEDLQLLGKVLKSLEIDAGLPKYEEDHEYFLKKEGQYHRIRRLSGLLRLFPDHKSEIKRYKRSIKLRGGVDHPKNEEKLTMLVEYSEKMSGK